jgi:hypothetical protein
MSPTREIRASRLANFAMDDGDDLHITRSYRADEENSSTVGNASCMGPPRLTTFPIKEKATSDDGSTASVVSSSSVMIDDSQTKKKESKPILRRIIPFPGGLSHTRRLWPWRLNSLRLRQQRQPKVIQEYQPMVEEGETSPTTSGVATLNSTTRSSRLNVANGKSLLVRQNAQVMGRQSMAQAEWDIASSVSSDSGRSRRSVTWDNASFSCLSDVSHLTGDSFSSSKSKRSDFSFSRAMYTTSEGGGGLLGETQSEASGDHEQDENVAPNSTFFEDMYGCYEGENEPSKCLPNSDGKVKDADEKMLSPKMTGARELVNRLLHRKDNSDKNKFASWDVFAGLSSDEWPESPPGEVETPVRERIFSDSDFVFEMQRLRSEEQACGYEISLPSSPGDDDLRFPINNIRDETVGNGRARTYSDSVVHFTMDMPAPAPRQRLMSDPQLDSDLQDSPYSRAFCLSRTRILSDSDITTSSGSVLVRPSHHSRHKSTLSPNQPRARADSASEFISSRRQSHESEYSQRRVSDTGHAHFASPRTHFFSDSEVTASSFATVQTRPALNWHMHTAAPTTRHQRPRTNSDSELSTNRAASVKSERSRNENTKRVDEGPQARRPLQAISSLSSPTALSAARMIASALGPAPVPTRNPCSQDYYWNLDSDSDPSSPMGEEVLWSLTPTESIDDIL